MFMFRLQPRLITRAELRRTRTTLTFDSAKQTYILEAGIIGQRQDHASDGNRCRIRFGWVLIKLGNI